MLSKRTAKPHKVKWAEAEREIAISWNLPPSPPIGREFFPEHGKHTPSQPAPIRNLEEKQVDLLR